jgi:hypothetical protein
MGSREGLIKGAFWLEWITAGWMLIEATIAIGSGVAAHSLTLIAFDADSIIELLSACLLLWRLSVELREGEKFSEATERMAARGQRDPAHRAYRLCGGERCMGLVAGNGTRVLGSRPRPGSHRDSDHVRTRKG